MKYLRLSKSQIDGLQMFMNSSYKTFELERATLENGDTLVLIADKDKDNSLKCIWVSKPQFDNIDNSQVFPYQF